MRFVLVIFLSAVSLISCGHLDIQKNIEALKQIKPGDTQDVVFKALGPPDLRHDINDQRSVAYYRTKAGGLTGASVSPALCTPVNFENGRVVAVGQDLTDDWTREEETRMHKAKIAENERHQTEMAVSARNQAQAVRQEKIKALEKAVQPVPATNATLNLKLYRQLLELDPGNPHYQKKVAYYEERLSRQERERQERAARASRERQREVWEKSRDMRNKTLRQYSGNGIAEMAVHDMGEGSLYVWVKNVGKQVITTYPDNFTLVDKGNNKIRCEVSDSLDSVLEPGSISHGKIEYDGEIIPKELIFQNHESGRIVKSFQ